MESWTRPWIANELAAGHNTMLQKAALKPEPYGELLHGLFIDEDLRRVTDNSLLPGSGKRKRGFDSEQLAW